VSLLDRSVAAKSARRPIGHGPDCDSAKRRLGEILATGTMAAVGRRTAMKRIMGWVRLHPYNIAQMVEIVVEHYRQYVAPLLQGKAKAMVVVGSRAEAVRW
jgi:hypothetical protein